MPRAAAIYARISQDRTGDGLGVRRQISDCEAEAERRGWPVAEVYVDDDLSAYSGTHRPGYAKLLADITDGTVDAVLVYHLDRLTRRPKELEEFVEVCDAVKLRHVATLQGDVNLGNGDGLLIARIASAVAANESDAKSRRVRRKMDEIAQTGIPHGGSNRPYGFETDKVTVRESEAQVIRTLAERLLAGESLTSLARWLNDEGIPTSVGKQWRAQGVRHLLMSPRLAGLRVHRGQVIGPGAWPAIITEQQSERIIAKLSDPARRTNRTARRYLLAGMLRCHRCEAVLLSHPRKDVRRYVCKSGQGLPGCGGVNIDAERVEELITEGVLHRLDTPELAAALNGQLATDEHTAALSDDIAADEAQLEELATLYGNKEITAAEWSTARKPIDARLTQAKRQLARHSNHRQLDGLIGQGIRLREQWSGLNLDRQRAIVAVLLDHAIVGPGPSSGQSRFDPDRVRPVWRL